MISYAQQHDVLRIVCKKNELELLLGMAPSSSILIPTTGLLVKFLLPHERGPMTELDAIFFNVCSDILALFPLGQIIFQCACFHFVRLSPTRVSSYKFMCEGFLLLFRMNWPDGLLDVLA